MPGPLYARWKPPKPPASQEVAAPPPAASPVPKAQPIASPPASERRKKDKRSKKGLREQTDQNEDVPKESESAPAVVEEEIAPDQVPKPAKKPKKRKRDAPVEEEIEETASKKHKAVLSKYDKVLQQAEARKAATNEEDEADQEEKPLQTLHDLEPLPQPDPIPEPEVEPTFSVLPSWLAHPTTVDATKKVPFRNLGVEPRYLEKLEKQGFSEALAVQSALLPMLHEGYEQHLGDICVSAKTGSGKTLAYLLPIIEALKDRVVTNLSAIVVVPKRQLVDQVVQVAEGLCSGTKLKVGTAVGSVPFTTEQKQLVRRKAQYNPQRARELRERAAKQFQTGFIEGSTFEDFMELPEDQVPHYESAVDILVCTPGRLVEHIESTTGFLLRSVRWLVIDEADQLLNQDFQGWATMLMDALHGETPNDLKSTQEQLRDRRRLTPWSLPLTARRQVTKVILSATMEKDLTRLGTLQLKRPKLVVVQEDTSDEQAKSTEGDVFELPGTLDEYAVAVGDGRNKPLYLLYFLVKYVFQHETLEADANRVLVFTKSNESASRLAHLLSVLEPRLDDYLRTMTPSATAKASKKLLSSFSAGKTKILIASDAASRGLDIPDITHVVNYDMPPSVTSYVHRVGRTARAGKSGQAWTLFSKTEAAWFWNQLARGESVRRGEKKVHRVEWKENDVTWDRKRTYAAALQELESAVKGEE